MRIFLVRPGELGRPELARWEELQNANPYLKSPYFTHQFTSAAAAARGDVRVAIMEEAHRIVGFFPHQQRWSIGAPVGGRLSDHHGVVCEPGLRWDWRHLLQACRLAYWPFDHLPACQAPPVPLVAECSPGLDLSRGYDAWWTRRTGATGALSCLPRKSRKLEREFGPLRFEENSRDPAVFARVLQLKSEQCRRTGQPDFFAWNWTQALVSAVRDTDEQTFGGRLSALYVGDMLMAAHFGMRSSRVWHWWFPVYNAQWRRFSPGALLLLKVAEAAAAGGHDLLDLGKGPERYKTSFADSAQPLVEGVVSRPALLTFVRTLRKGTGRWLRAHGWRGQLKPWLPGA
jgi:CelD/BcsL family acetyltransferase involved in cellulose biosynthesis